MPTTRTPLASFSIGLRHAPPSHPRNFFSVTRSDTQTEPTEGPTPKLGDGGVSLVGSFDGPLAFRRKELALTLGQPLRDAAHRLGRKPAD
jgi:hypothetical protein